MGKNPVGLVLLGHPCMLMKMQNMRCIYSHKQDIIALCSTLKKPKLFHKRNVRDIHINVYIKELAMTLQANPDIQYILFAYSYLMYMCDYMKKAPKSMGTLIAGACKEAKDDNMTLKQSVHHMANKFLNILDSPVMGACYDGIQWPVM